MSFPRITQPLLLHPVFLCALMIWAFNDHIMKRFYPGLISGKLSDAAALVVMPVTLVALCEVVGLPISRLSAWIICTTIIAVLILTLTNLNPMVATTYRMVVGLMHWPFHALLSILTGSTFPDLIPAHLTQDPTDIWTLPFALIAPGLARVTFRKIQ